MVTIYTDNPGYLDHVKHLLDMGITVFVDFVPGTSHGVMDSVLEELRTYQVYLVECGMKPIVITQFGPIQVDEKCPDCLGTGMIVNHDINMPERCHCGENRGQKMSVPRPKMQSTG